MSNFAVIVLLSLLLYYFLLCVHTAY